MDRRKKAQEGKHLRGVMYMGLFEVNIMTSLGGCTSFHGFKVQWIEAFYDLWDFWFMDYDWHVTLSFIAMLRRSREKQAKQDNMQQYYIVIGVFVGVCVLAAIYTFLNPQQSFSQMPVIDESSILVHNGQNHRFTQAPNAFFEVSGNITLLYGSNVIVCFL